MSKIEPPEIPPNGPDAPAPNRVRRRPLFLRVLGWGIKLGVVAAIIIALAIVFLPAGRIIPFPEWARAQIQQRMDAQMPGGDVQIGEIGFGRSQSGERPQIVIRDVTLRSDGEERASLPELSMEINGAAALTGAFEPRRLIIRDAGIRLIRLPNGQIDLALSGDHSARTGDLGQTMAGIDRMLGHPVFAGLEEVRGDRIRLELVNSETGDVFAISDAMLSLAPGEDGMNLTVGGVFDESVDARAEVSILRRTEVGATRIEARFENIEAALLAQASDALTFLTLIDAPLNGELSTELYDDLSLGHLVGALEVGPGLLNPGGSVAPQMLDRLFLAFDYNVERSRLQIEELSIASPSFTGRISGHADLIDGPSYLAQLQLAEVTTNPNEVFESAVVFSGGALDMRLQIDPILRLDIGQLVLFNDELHLTARGSVAAEVDGLALQIDAEIPDLIARNALAFWPAGRVPNTRNWIDQNLLDGRAENLNAAIRILPGRNPQIAATLDILDAHVRVLRGAAPIQNGIGYLSLVDNALTIALHEGQVTAPNGDLIDLSGSVMTLDDTRQRTPNAHIDLAARSTIPAALAFIGAEPLTLLDQFPQNPATVARGHAELDVTLDFRMQRQIQTTDVSFEVAGTLHNVRSDELVPGRQLSSSRLTVLATPQHLEIGGIARLDDLQAQALWSRDLGPGSGAFSQVEGTATLTANALAGFGVRLPQGMVTGASEAAFLLELTRGAAPNLTVESDLSGLGLAIPALGWSLGQGQRGQLEAEIQLGDAPSVRRLLISGAGLSLDAAVTLAGGQFQEMPITRLTIANWLDISGSLVSRGAGIMPGIQVTGGQFDLRGFQPSGQGGGSMPLDIQLDRLTVADGIFLTGLDAELAGQPMSGEFRGLMGGQSSLSGLVVMQAEGPSLDIRAGDGGAVLRAAGVFEDAYGGAMSLVLRPLPGEGRFNGYLEIDNPRLRDAPAIAELLNAISVVGLLEQMASGEGIALGDVEARFQLSPERVTLQEVTAVGPSMGISLQGIVDTATDYFDFEGVVSPLYVVNGLIGGIFTPRREGLFGFTYRITGTPGNSSVSVNPLSVLTPGIFREIFRRPPPQAQ